MSNELYQLAKKYGTDKAGGIDLASFYHEYLKDRRNEVRKVLEIGIGADWTEKDAYRFGGSIYMWEEYFPNAEIYALDIVPSAMINQGRIQSFVCDQGSESSLKGIMLRLGRDFDLIVDDGSHVPEHQILTANIFMDLLAPRGIYFIEDMQTKYVQDIQNGVYYKSTVQPFIDGIGHLGNTVLVIKEEDQ